MGHIFYSEETYGNNGVLQNIGETTTNRSELVSEYVTVMDAVRLAVVQFLQMTHIITIILK